MPTLSSPYELKKYRSSLEGKVGFVPTMGALHEGHKSLVQQARKECDHVIVSVFVNPTQFDDEADLKNYPQTLGDDLDLLESLGVDLVFTPQFEDLYPDHYNYEIFEKELSTKFCGANRPGHFNGVLTVVMKLLQIASPTFAYFGEKDYQQLQLIEGLTKAFFMDCSIRAVPIVREPSGLALSSRNKHLNEEQKQQAAQFHKILETSATAQEASDRLQDQGFKVDYVEETQNRRLGAIHFHNVRLIDNVPL